MQRSQKESKSQRQVIVVTHNANIPVNGDADYIVSMDSESEYVKIKYHGTMDNKDIRDEVCNVANSEPERSVRRSRTAAMRSRAAGF